MTNYLYAGTAVWVDKHAVKLRHWWLVAPDEDAALAKLIRYNREKYPESQSCQPLSHSVFKAPFDPDKFTVVEELKCE